ncbi:MAG: hypothetical protein PHQ75_03185, partial [Thermoguttaceae bacterium]|nr:hypothetical protein [Thermoguttaceae bacterium]
FCFLSNAPRSQGGEIYLLVLIGNVVANRSFPNCARFTRSIYGLDEFSSYPKSRSMTAKKNTKRDDSSFCVKCNPKVNTNGRSCPRSDEKKTPPGLL